ncbi:MAG: hypothetical protein ACM3PY_14825 [Omnitrophica WOR_2 bacterium]
MNSTTWFGNLEIAFWNTVIPLMSESRLVQWLVQKTYLMTKGGTGMIKLFKFLVLSMAIVTVGFTLFYMIANLEPTQGVNSSPVQAPQAAAPLATLPNGQRSLLVVATSDLTQEQPELVSAWLILFVPPEPHMTLMPLYPSSPTGNEETDSALAAAFRLGPRQHELSQDFLLALHARDLWWSGYIVMDDYALSHILSALGPENARNLEGTGNISSSMQNSQLTLLNQATLYQEVCWRISRPDNADQLIQDKKFIRLMSGHIYSDLSTKDALRELHQLEIPFGGLYCEFPTLSIQTQASW